MDLLEPNNLFPDEGPGDVPNHHAPDSSVGPLSKIPSRENKYLLKDLGTFLISHIIQVGTYKTREELCDYVGTEGELQNLIDPILSLMEKDGTIRVSATGEIELLKDSFHSFPGVENIASDLFEASANRVSGQIKKGLANTNREFLRFFAFPDTPEIAKKIHEASLAYKYELLKIAKDHEKDKGDDLRVVEVLSCTLKPEDTQ